MDTVGWRVISSVYMQYGKKNTDTETIRLSRYDNPEAAPRFVRDEKNLCRVISYRKYYVCQQTRGGNMAAAGVTVRVTVVSGRNEVNLLSSKILREKSPKQNGRRYCFADTPTRFVL